MSLQQPPQSYLYGEYSDDQDLVASRKVFNAQVQSIYSWLINTCLSDYRQDPVSGALLDWVGLGVYGMARRLTIPGSGGLVKSPWADGAWAEAVWAGLVVNRDGASVVNLTDDLFRRALTWNTYLADGSVFTTTWLRRRVIRFLYGANGFDVNTANWYSSISIEWVDARQAKVVLPGDTPQDLLLVLSYGLSTGYLRTPIGYTFLLQ